LRRRVQVERLLNWAWDRYDWLNDWQRIGLGLAVVLLLTSSSMYCLGAASLVALSRHPETASAEAEAESDATATPPVVLEPVRTEVNPISPLLADRTPTLRPSATPTVRGQVPPTHTPTPRPSVSTSPLSPNRATGPATATRTLVPVATATRPATATVVRRTSTPTPTHTSTPAAGGASMTLPWGDAPARATPSPTRRPVR